MKATIENHTDKSIYTLEKFQWVEYGSSSKYSEGAFSFTLATIPLPKYTKHIYVSDSLIEIEYLEDSRVNIDELYTSDNIGRYTYCLGEEYFIPCEDDKHD